MPSASEAPRGPIKTSKRASVPELPPKEISALSAAQLLYRSPRGTVAGYRNTDWFGSMAFYRAPTGDNIHEAFTVSEEIYFEMPSAARKISVKTDTLTCWETPEADLLKCWAITPAEFVSFSDHPPKGGVLDQTRRDQVAAWIGAFVAQAEKVPAPKVPTDAWQQTPVWGQADSKDVDKRLDAMTSVGTYAKDDKDSFTKQGVVVWMNNFFVGHSPEITHVTTAGRYVCGLSVDHDAMQCYSSYGEGMVRFSINRTYVGDPEGKTVHAFPARDKYDELIRIADEFIPAAMTKLVG